MTRDRKSKVRVQGHIADDGYARWRISLANSDSETPKRLSEEILGWTWLANMVDASKSMRFSSPTVLEVMGGSRFDPQPLQVDIETGQVRQVPFDSDSSDDMPWMTRSEPNQYPGDAARVEAKPAFVIGSSDRYAPVDGSPDTEMSRVQLNVVSMTVPRDMPTWRQAVEAYAMHIWDNAAEWNRWWILSGREELEIWMEIATHPEDGPPCSKVRAGKIRCTGRFTRVNEPGMSPSDQVRVAEHNVRAMLDQAAQRLQLPAHPPLPTASIIATALKVMDDNTRELVTFIKSLRGRLSKHEVQEMLQDISEGSLGEALHGIELWLSEGRLELSLSEQERWLRLRQTTG